MLTNLLLLVAALAFLAGALGSAALVALDAANRVRLKTLTGGPGLRAHAAGWVLDEPVKAWLAANILCHLGLALAATTGVLALVITGIFDAWLAMSPAERDAMTINVIVGRLAGFVALSTLVVAALGAWLPAALARRDETAALWRLAAPLYVAATALKPILPLARGLEHLVGGPIEVDRSWREEELRALAHVDEDEEPIEQGAIQMIAGIFGLGDRRVREVMVPRIDMVTVQVGSPISAMVDTIIGCGHSRIPVVGETVDDVLGVLYAKDVLKAYRDRDFSPDVRNLMREPRFVPESKPVTELLSELQQSRVHLVIAVDEFGGTAGLVTIEDLLEEIVGDIQDEYDTEEAEVESLGESEGIFRASIRIDDVNRKMGLQLPSERDDNLAGLVFSQLGRLAQVGDKVMFDDATVEVLAVGGRRIRRVRVVRRGDWEDEAGG